MKVRIQRTESSGDSNAIGKIRVISEEKTAFGLDAGGLASHANASTSYLSDPGHP